MDIGATEGQPTPVETTAALFANLLVITSIGVIARSVFRLAKDYVYPEALLGFLSPVINLVHVTDKPGP